MSEEDKILKKMKIDQNRLKRKPIVTGNIKIPVKIKREVAWLMEEGSAAAAEAARQQMLMATTIRSSGGADADDNTSDSQQSGGGGGVGFKKHPIVPDPELESMFPLITSSTEQNGGGGGGKSTMPTLDSSSTEIVDRLVNYPEETSKLINHLMKTPRDAVTVITKVINSQKDAMRLIGHLIGSPGDALKIISKIMNSPFDALTVFTKFMSSPTDALEIIAKIASSPGEVLQFIQQLMNSPEDALQIMNKFMNSPAEALKMLNKMVNNPSVDSTTTTTGGSADEAAETKETTDDSHPMINSILGNKCGNAAAGASTVNGDGKKNTAPTAAAKNGTATCEKNSKIGIKTDGGGANDVGASDTIRSLLKDVHDEPVLPNSLESVICEAINLEYDAYSSMAQAGTNNRDLNEAERAKLNELIVANKALYAPLDEDLTGLDECSINVRTQNYELQPFKYV